MTQSSLDDAGNDGRADKLIKISKSFVEVLHERAPKSRAEAAINRDAALRGEELHQNPERFIEEQLIRDVAEMVLKYEYRPEVKGINGLNNGTPDFEVLNTDHLVLGEIKKPNGIERASSESHEYLQACSPRPAIGISTDGWTWILHIAKEGEAVRNYSQQPLRPIIKELGRRRRHESKTEDRDRVLREDVIDFIETFHIDALSDIV